MKILSVSILLVALMGGTSSLRVSCTSDDPTTTPTMEPTTPLPTTATPDPAHLSTKVPITPASSTPVPTTPAPTSPVPIGPRVRFTTRETLTTVEVAPALSVCYDLTCLEGGSFVESRAAWEAFPDQETTINFFNNLYCTPDQRTPSLPAGAPLSLGVGSNGFMAFSITVGGPLPSAYAGYESVCPAPPIL